jgi:5-methylcytosine-specific restriction endonuclease McrA
MAGSGLSPTKVMHQCRWCDESFYPKRTDRLTFCSRACAYAYRDANRASPEELARRLQGRIEAARADHPLRRCACGATFSAKTKNQRRCSRDCPAAAPAPIAPTVQCAVCGTSYRKRRWDRGHCSVECRVKDRRSKTRERNRLSGAKAASRKARKLKQRGVTVETVNPLKVLARDGWCCQLCGRPTPRRLRGTYEARAPEVDHIIPLALGGEHSYRNTQCACRECNLLKSSMALGQLRLF